MRKIRVNLNREVLGGRMRRGRIVPELTEKAVQRLTSFTIVILSSDPPNMMHEF